MPTAQVVRAMVWVGISLAAAASPAQERTASTSSPLLVVMSDGRVLTGQVVRHAAGYYVERPNGRIFIPSEQVRCVARDLPDAYRQQRESMIDPSATSLMNLAEWCIAQKLYDSAQDELRSALRRDPENEIAQRMLTRLETLLLTEPNRAAPQATTPNPAWLMAPEVESLGGLSKPVATAFSTKIHPLLMNKCGNSSCHGASSTSDFRLARASGVNNRRTAEVNLKAIIEQIDLADPTASPLLTAVKGAHGGLPSTIFGGAGGAEQWKLLQQWVESVATERQTEAQKLARRDLLKPAPSVKAAKSSPTDVVLASTRAPEIPSGKRPEQPEPSTPSPKPLALEARERALPMESPQGSRRRNDRFDPEEFNRQYGTDR